QTLGERLKDSGVFPPMVVQRVIVGELTGALDNMLAKVADYYEDEVDVAVSGLTALLEPLLIVFLGVVIGGIVIAIYLPIFKVVTLVK
ncbi:MAG: type II secretion system F family protein, partial [Anaerolineales bacterium]